MRKETLTAFEALANELHMSFRNVPNEFVELASEHFALRVREDIDQIEGVYVTIRRQSGSQTEYGLSYLIEFRGGTPGEVEITVGKDAVAICGLVKRYSSDYLRGAAHDFAKFEAFAQEKVAERFPAARQFRTNKWVRAEWIEEDKQEGR